MVMATEVLHSGQQVGHEETELEGDTGEASVLHEQLVRHVLAISGELESRSDVWGEHSYARARGAAANSQIRSLLPETEPEPEADDFVDVETVPRGAPPPPLDRDDEDDDDDYDEPAGEAGGDEDDDWERRLAALAPSAAHARLAAAAADALRALRLERLAGGRGRWARREGARAAARRVRRALAAQWGGGAAWLHAALLAALPRELRAPYAELVEELRRAVPRLAERLPAPRPRAPHADPLDAVAERRDASAPGPWLAWAPSGCRAEDERWLRRLGALLHVRELRAEPAAPPDASAAPPDRWCAALAHDARAALADVLAEAGRRAVLLGGAGAGAALAAWLAAGAGARVRGLLLLAPPLLTAEGPRDRPDDVLQEVDAPLLAVVGGGAAQCWRGAAAELAQRCGAPGGGEGGARRVLQLAGADDALRLPAARRRRLGLPQQALDAAVAEECARWAAELPPAARRRRDEPRAAGRVAPERTEPDRVALAEGRVAPPRRAERQELAAADIMRLPIVFADDEPPAPAPAPAGPAPDEPALTVTSERRAGAGPGAGGAARGALQYTRVIVAKRGARPVLLRRRAPPAPPAPPHDA